MRINYFPGPMRSWPCFRSGWIFSLIFATQALILLPYPGLQTDEALFASVLYEPRNLELSLPAFQHRIPLMVMSYLGSLKAGIYAVWFALWPPSPLSVRLPVILAGALTVWLFFRLLHATLGRRAAWLGALLLATDPSFLLTTTFDWGPVALQHLLLVGGMALLARFHRNRRTPALAAAFFLFGLGLWDKAIFIWMLSGVAAAALVVFRRELSETLTPRHALAAVLGGLLGALPLIIYNLRYDGPTLRHARYSASDLPGKLHLLRVTLDGSSLFGYLTREDDGRTRQDRLTALERAALTVSDAAGRPRTNLMPYLLSASAVLLPLVWRTAARRAFLFAVIAAGIGWAQMALNQDTGGSTHHTVLLWPMPPLMVAAVLAEITRRLRRTGLYVLVTAAALAMVSNILVTNEHLAQFLRHGPGPAWSDAISPLAERLQRAPAGSIVVTDWGVLDSLRLLGRGRFPLYQAIDLASKDVLSPEDRQALQWLLTLPDPIFVGHAPPEETVVGSSARLAAHAAQAGYSKRLLYTVADRHARPVFEVFRFEPISAPAPPSSR